MCLVIPYYRILGACENPFHIRIEMVQFAIREGISAAARAFSTTRKTVRKWLARYEEKGTAGLKDQSRAPRRIPHKTAREVEEKALRIRRRLPGFGPDRIAADFSVGCSGGALRRIFRQRGMVKKRRRKHQKRRDLRERKARLKPFEKVQIDTKDLSDIPEIQEAILRGDIPRYQFTAREVRTGALYLAFAKENTLTNATLFGCYVLSHLQRQGVVPEGAVVQTDNGCEYVGSYNAKKESAFSVLARECGFQHRRIPPGAKTWQSDVETSHRRIEPEFYEVEKLASVPELLAKARTYHLYFNFQRRNSYRGWKTPEMLLEELSPEAPKSALFLPPILLDNLSRDLYSTPPEFRLLPGYHVPSRI